MASEAQLFVSVRLACEAVSLNVVALPHVMTLINNYLLATLETASAAGFVYWLDYLKPLEWFGLDQSFRERRFDSAVDLATRKGQIQVLDWWLTNYMPGRAKNAIPRMLQQACTYNRLDVLQWMQSQGHYELLGRPVKVQCHTPEIADWIFHHLRNKTTTKYSLRFFSNDGFTMFKTALHRDVRCSFICIYKGLADVAAADGHLEAVQWMNNHTHHKCSSVALNVAVNQDELLVAQWLYQKFPRGHFDKLTYGCDESVMIEWVLSHYEWIDQAEKKHWIASCLYRAKRWWTQKLDVLEHLVLACPEADNGDAMVAAAIRGDLQIILRLHACGAKSVSKAMNEAASNGHLSVLRWLHEFRDEGCTNDAVKFAAYNGHLEVIQWLHQHKPQCFTTDAMDFAAFNGQLKALKWLHFNRTEGCTMQAMDLAATYGHAEIVQWLHDNRTEGCSVHALTGAAQRGDLGLVKYLYHHYPDFESAKVATRVAALFGRLNIVQFFTLRLQIRVEPCKISDIISNRHFAAAEWLLKESDRI